MKRFFIVVTAVLWIFSLAACASQEQEATTPGTSSTPPEATSEPTTPAPTDPNQLYISFSRENVITTIPVTIMNGTVGSYRIAVNPRLFEMNSYSGLDCFVYTNWPYDDTQIYYSVSYLEGISAQDAADGLVLQNDAAVSEPATLGEYEALAVYVSGTDDQLTQRYFYLIDHAGGCYMLETQFVMEMADGLYPQIRALLDTFTIVE